MADYKFDIGQEVRISKLSVPGSNQAQRVMIMNQMTPINDCPVSGDEVVNLYTVQGFFLGYHWTTNVPESELVEL